MAKAPISGRTGTEFISMLGPEVAAKLHKCFLLDTIEKASATPDTELAISYSPVGTLPFFRQIAPDANSFLLQKGQDIGERFSNCFGNLCEPGKAVVALGTDSPTLPARSLELAFDALASEQVDVVIGPVKGDGCYLIGMNSPNADLFQGIRWNKAGILQDLIERAAELGLGWYLLPEWYSIDRPSALTQLKKELLYDSTVNSSARHTKELLRNFAVRGMI